MITIFLVLLAISGLVDAALGIWAIAGWSSFTSFFLNGSTLGGTAQMMGFLLGLVLLFFSYLQVQAILWIRQENEDGYRIGLSFAIWLVASSVVMWLRFQMPIFLMIDGARGLILGVIGWVAIYSPNTISKLTLPTGSSHTKPGQEERPSTRGRRSSSSSRERYGSSRGRGSSSRDRGSSSRDHGSSRGRSDTRRSPGRDRRPSPPPAMDSPSEAQSSPRRSSSRRRTSTRRRSRPSDGDQAAAGPQTGAPEALDRSWNETPSVDQPKPYRSSRRGEPQQESSRSFNNDRNSHSSDHRRQTPRSSETRNRDFRLDREAPPEHLEERPIVESRPPLTESRDSTRDSSRAIPSPVSPPPRQRNGYEDRIEPVAAGPLEENDAPRVYREETGPPQNVLSPNPKDVISALGWFKPDGQERTQNPSEGGIHHRRKTSVRTGARFRPREKRNHRSTHDELENHDNAGGTGGGTQSKVGPVDAPVTPPDENRD
ncbi:MAG: hypothetical protein KJ970_08970 [Candidatus Eisenbacteria bacterium]|uniref:Uncharacterized protein n=1 Tax=Eiseniibacteriota bacterium TaxID=2212470 RepID=A0A948RWX3_UNCEI|nr:hypothetical protein [Candidatus Eisenbacteria bacterium]MBU1948562.1 hypothetical protein [Candidatus Eisenbacteria bacterium]MBU2691048.1 hypothetical protein [Candidatus Eisenbacteria bacterium]